MDKKRVKKTKKQGKTISATMEIVITSVQFADRFDMAEKYCKELGFESLPAVILTNFSVKEGWLPQAAQRR